MRLHAICHMFEVGRDSEAESGIVCVADLLAGAAHLLQKKHDMGGYALVAPEVPPSIRPHCTVLDPFPIHLGADEICEDAHAVG